MNTTKLHNPPTWTELGDILRDLCTALTQIDAVMLANVEHEHEAKAAYERGVSALAIIDQPSNDLPKPARAPDAQSSSVILDAKGWEDLEENRFNNLLAASECIEQFCNNELDNVKLTIYDADYEYAALVLVILTPLLVLGATKPTASLLPAQVGWSNYQTGGGCMALYHDTPSGYALITDDGGSEIPTADSPCLLGFYDEDGQPIDDDEEWTHISNHPTLAVAMVAFRAQIATWEQAD